MVNIHRAIDLGGFSQRISCAWVCVGVGVCVCAVQTGCKPHFGCDVCQVHRKRGGVCLWVCVSVCECRVCRGEPTTENHSEVFFCK